MGKNGYRRAVASDVLRYIAAKSELKNWHGNRESLEEKLYEDLQDDDDIIFCYDLNSAIPEALDKLESDGKFDEKYYIEYGTGAGNKYVEGTLDEAKAEADKGASYTQCFYCIRAVDDNGNPAEIICIRLWWSTKYNPDIDDDDDIISFGDFGFYGSWQDAK